MVRILASQARVVQALQGDLGKGKIGKKVAFTMHGRQAASSKLDVEIPLPRTFSVLDVRLHWGGNNQLNLV
jgi:hypothetical protein